MYSSQLINYLGAYLKQLTIVYQDLNKYLRISCNAAYLLLANGQIELYNIAIASFRQAAINCHCIFRNYSSFVSKRLASNNLLIKAKFIGILILKSVLGDETQHMHTSP